VRANRTTSALDLERHADSKRAERGKVGVWWYAVRKNDRILCRTWFLKNRGRG
jgi:hypothetical protein